MFGHGIYGISKVRLRAAEHARSPWRCLPNLCAAGKKSQTETVEFHAFVAIFRGDVGSSSLKLSRDHGSLVVFCVRSGWRPSLFGEVIVLMGPLGQNPSLVTTQIYNKF